MAQPPAIGSIGTGSSRQARRAGQDDCPQVGQQGGEVMAHDPHRRERGGEAGEGRRPDRAAIGSTVATMMEPGSAPSARSIRGVRRTRLISSAPEVRQA